MADFETATRIAGAREVGAACPVCQTAIADGSPISVCRSCGAVHHEACWRKAGRCATYECAPGHQVLAADAAPALRITADDIASARPLAVAAMYPSARNGSSGLPAARRSSVNRLAVASFVTALLGIPLFGVITGIVAVVLAAIALGAIRATHQRGLVWAVLGMVLGLVDAVGWMIFLTLVLTGSAPIIHMRDFQPDLSTLNDLDPTIARAMRSNVLIQGVLGPSTHLGSGVILRIKDGQADILTNRHVVDPEFTASPEGVRAGNVSGSLSVQLVGQEQENGTVTWLAPEGIDLAVIRVPCTTDEARFAVWKQSQHLRVGDPVFAIGNPHGLGWTHTQGAISQFRLKDAGAHKLRVIQMQTAVNPGNSGGGLYDQQGNLVGIVTWSQDKRVSEGLNFAIAMESILPLLPGDLATPSPVKEKSKP